MCDVMKKYEDRLIGKGIEIGRERGIEIGEARGESLKEASIVKRMLARKMTQKAIAELTGLSLYRVRQIAREEG